MTSTRSLWCLLRRALAACAAGALSMASLPTVAADSALPPTLDPTAPFIASQEVLLLVPQGPAVRADELVTGLNQSAKPVSGLAFPLPPDAVGASLQRGAEPGAFSVDGDTAHLAVTVPPGGSASFGFTFTLSRAGGGLWLPVAYPTAEFTILVPHGRYRVEAPGFTRNGTTALSKDVVMDAYTTLAPTPGGRLPIRLVSLRWWDSAPVRIGAVLLGALVLVVALLRYVRLRSTEARRAEAELVDAVARLDSDRQQGLVAEDTYVERRQRLLDDLEGLHGL